MDYDILPSDDYLKDLRKIKEKPLRKMIIDIVYRELALDPIAGDFKSHDLESYITWNFESPQKVRKNNRTAYRIAYQVDESAKTILLIMVGTHENFYEKLKRRIN